MNMKIVGRQGLRLCSNSASKFSLSAPKWVLSEVDNIVPKSIVWWSGRSFSSSNPFGIIEPRKSYKRVSKDARKGMVESFVNEYQSLNEGKFPTVTQTKKQVGGSYYVLKKILQELEHKTTVFYSKTDDKNAQEKKPYKERECLIQTLDESSSSMSLQEKIKSTSTVKAVLDTQSDVDGDEHLKANSRSQDSAQVTRPFPGLEPRRRVSDSNTGSTGYIPKRKTKNASSTSSKLNDSTVDIILDNYVDLDATKSHFPKEKEKNSHLRLGIVVDDKTTKLYEDSAEFERTKNEKRQQEGSIFVDKDHMSKESFVGQNKDEDLSKKSSMWENLKSFADGIMSRWKKR